MNLFDVFDERFDKGLYEDKIIGDLLSSLKDDLEFINGKFSLKDSLFLWRWPLKDLSKIKELLGGDLVKVDGIVDCSGNKNLKSLGGCGLKRIGGSLNIIETAVDDLGELEYLGGKFICDDDRVEYFLNNYGDIVGLNLFIDRSLLEKFNNDYIYYQRFSVLNLKLKYWPYKDLGLLRKWLKKDLSKIYGNVDCSGNRSLRSLGGCGLRWIEFDLDLSGSSVDDLGDLEFVGGKFVCDEDKREYFLKKYKKVIGINLFFDRFNFESMKNKYFFNNSYFDLRKWPFEDLSMLREFLGGDLVMVDGIVDCSGNKNLKSLGGCGLKRINRNLDIKDSGVVDLGDLKHLGEYFYCDEDKKAYFRNSKWGKFLKILD